MTSPCRLLAPLALAALASLSARPAGAGPEKRLVLAIWSNYLSAETVTAFEKETGARVETAWNYGSGSELVAKLQGKATGFDLAVPSDTDLPVLVKEGLVEPIDAAKTPNRRHLDEAFAARTSDPKGEWSVPYTWGTVGIAWRTDKVAGAVDSWGVFGSDRGGGNAFLLEEARDGIGAALLFRGRDPNSVDPAHWKEAKETLVGWKKRLKGFTAEVKDHLLSGEAWLLMAYNGDVAQAMLERRDLAYAVPKEGGILWVDAFVVPKGAPHKDLAHAFLDFLMRPDVAAKGSASIRYATCNRAALPLLPAAVRDDPVIYAPEDVRKRCVQLKDLGADTKRAADLWAQVRAGN